MNWQLVFVLALVSLACFVHAKQPGKGKKPDNRKREKLAKPRDTCIGGICTRNMGKSGSFEIKKENQNDTDKMTVLFNAIYERSVNGSKVGKKGKLKHSLENFAQLDFLYTTIEETLFNGSVNASYFTFTVEIPGSNANLSVNMYFFSASGTGDICDKETFSIYPGMVKFDITIEGWTFCTPAECGKGEEGELVDFLMTFQKKGKSKLGKKPNKGGAKKVVEKLIIGDQDIGLPKTYELNGDKCGQMPEGYPKVRQRGDKYTVVFRFPKFTSKVFYDPTAGDSRDAAEFTDTSAVEQETTEPPPVVTTTSDSAGSHILPSLLATAFLGVVARLFF